MNTTTTTHVHVRRWAIAVAAAVTTVIPSAAVAGPQPVGNPATVIRDHGPQHSTTDDEYRTIVNHAGFRPCFIIQPHWNTAYDGFVPECPQPSGDAAAARPAAGPDCPPPIDPRYVGVPWVPRVATGCDSRDRWWTDVIGR